jgi:hypothetical protein
MKNKLVPYITSSPGMSKSALIAEIADEANLKLIDLRLSQIEPHDLHGIPFQNNNHKAEYLPFDTFPLETDPIPEGYSGWIILFDEFGSTEGGTQIAAQKIIDTRLIGNHKLHNKCYLVACGNRQEDNCYVVPMAKSLCSRLVHFTLELTTQEWVTYAAETDIDGRIISFIQYKPSALNMFDPSSKDTTFPCPRTWSILSKLIKPYKDLTQHKALIEGVVGESVSYEFQLFLRYFEDLPTIQEIIENPYLAVPHDLGKCFATIQHIAENVELKELSKILLYISKFNPEFQVIFGKKLIAKYPTILKTNIEFQQFNIRFAND